MGCRVPLRTAFCGVAALLGVCRCLRLELVVAFRGWRSAGVEELQILGTPHSVHGPGFRVQGPQKHCFKALCSSSRTSRTLKSTEADLVFRGGTCEGVHVYLGLNPQKPVKKKKIPVVAWQTRMAVSNHPKARGPKL